MAQVYWYLYKGELRTKQDKCRTSLPLDKARVQLDFSELCGTAPGDGAPVYWFSQADIVNDSDGNDVALYDGMAVSVFDGDYDPAGKPDAILADGVVLKNDSEASPKVKWLIRLVKHGRGGGNEYVYWMSDFN